MKEKIVTKKKFLGKNFLKTNFIEKQFPLKIKNICKKIPRNQKHSDKI